IVDLRDGDHWKDDEPLSALNDARRLVARYQDFMKFFAGAHTDVNDPRRLVAKAFDHHLGEVGNPAGRHFHDHDFAADRLALGFQHETNRIFYPKEEARHLRFGDGDGVRLPNLFDEQRDDAPVGAENVSSPETHEI